MRILSLFGRSIDTFEFLISGLESCPHIIAKRGLTTSHSLPLVEISVLDIVHSSGCLDLFLNLSVAGVPGSLDKEGHIIDVSEVVLSAHGLYLSRITENLVEEVLTAELTVFSDEAVVSAKTRSKVESKAS